VKRQREIHLSIIVALSNEFQKETTMKEKDLYEDVCKYYEFMLGPIPNKEKLKGAMRETISSDDLHAFFLIPFTGYISIDKLEQKARKASISPDALGAGLQRLHTEGFILAYDKPEGRSFERGNPAYMTEQQVRKHDDTPRRMAYAEFFNAIIDGATAQVPSKSPYYRVLPVESTLIEEAQSTEITLDLPIPDAREVLPVDRVSEMIKSVSLIGVADCYCRKTKMLLGEGCGHPLETCFVFEELAQTLIEIGNARRIDHAETLQILQDCEKQGLVHHVDNCEGQIKSLCNCCACSCVIMKCIERGQTNAGAPSRFVAVLDAGKCTLHKDCIDVCPTQAIEASNGTIIFDSEKCIGCGLCVTACPEGALSLVPREKSPRIFKTHQQMMGTIGREAIFGLAKKRLLGR
jgi:electron transport complex protein RnfB